MDDKCYQTVCSDSRQRDTDKLKKKVFAMTVVNSVYEITQCLNRPLSIFKPLGDLSEHKRTQLYLLSSSEILDLTWGCHTGLNTLNGQAVETFQCLLSDNAFTPIHNQSSISHDQLQAFISGR